MVRIKSGHAKHGTGLGWSGRLRLVGMSRITGESSGQAGGVSVIAKGERKVCKEQKSGNLLLPWRLGGEWKGGGGVSAIRTHVGNRQADGVCRVCHARHLCFCPGGEATNRLDSVQIGSISFGSYPTGSVERWCRKTAVRFGEDFRVPSSDLQVCQSATKGGKQTKSARVRVPSCQLLRCHAQPPPLFLGCGGPTRQLHVTAGARSWRRFWVPGQEILCSKQARVRSGRSAAACQELVGIVLITKNSFEKGRSV